MTNVLYAIYEIITEKQDKTLIQSSFLTWFGLKIGQYNLELDFKTIDEIKKFLYNYTK